MLRNAGIRFDTGIGWSDAEISIGRFHERRVEDEALVLHWARGGPMEDDWRTTSPGPMEDARIRGGL